MRSIRLLPWLGAALAAGLAVPALAGAASISQVGTGFGALLVRPNGAVRAVGPIICSDGPVRVVVTITQGRRAARGVWTGPCTGARQRYGPLVARRFARRPALRPGSAYACANATITHPGISVATGWCGPVRLRRAL